MVVCYHASNTIVGSQHATTQHSIDPLIGRSASIFSLGIVVHLLFSSIHVRLSEATLHPLMHRHITQPLESCLLNKMY